MTWIRWKAPVRGEGAYNVPVEVCGLAEVPDLLAKHEILSLSARLFGSRADALNPHPDTIARYVPIVDFDARWCDMCGCLVTDANRGEHSGHMIGSRPELAAADARLFCAELRQRYGLTVGRDILAAPSGGKGWKLFMRYATPAGAGWPRAWRQYLESCRERMPTMDPAMATTDCARWLGSRHPKHNRWQNPLTGRPGPGRIARLSEHVLRQFAPDPDRESAGFTELAADVQAAYVISTLIDYDRRPSVRYRGANWGQALESIGVIATPCNRGGEALPWWRLARCPVCGRKRHAILYPESGRLHCYSPKCEGNAGLAPGAWSGKAGIALPSTASKGRTGPRLRKRPAVVALPIVEARETLSRGVADVLGGDVPTLVRATPGLGKTHAAIAAAAALSAEGMRFAFAVPTRELAAEVAGALRASRYGMRVAELEPRTRNNCSFMADVLRASAAGWSPGRAVCAGCPLRDSCDYYRRRRQAAQANVVVGPWESVFAIGARGRLGRGRRLIVDELPMRACVSRHTTRIADLETWADHTRVGPGAKLLIRVIESAEAGARAGRDWRVAGQALAQLVNTVAGGDLTPLFAIVAASGTLEPGAGWLFNATEDPPTRWVVDLATALVQLARNPAAAVGVRLVGPDLRFEQAAVNTPGVVPIAALDAYGSPGVYARLFGRSFASLRVDCEHRGQYIWIPTASSRAGFEARADRLHRRLADVSEMLPADALILSHSTELRWLREAKPQLNGRHFHAGHGVNAYESAPAVVCFGTPRVPPDELWLMASALYEGHPGVVMDYSEGAYTDSRLAAVADMITDQEIAQSVHRVRPAIHDRTVVLLTDTDCPLLPEPMLLSTEGFKRWGAVQAHMAEHGYWADVCARRAWGDGPFRQGKSARAPAADYRAICAALGAPSSGAGFQRVWKSTVSSAFSGVGARINVAQKRQL